MLQNPFLERLKETKETCLFYEWRHHWLVDYAFINFRHQHPPTRHLNFCGLVCSNPPPPPQQLWLRFRHFLPRHLLAKVNFLPLNISILKNKTCVFCWKDITPYPAQFKFPTLTVKCQMHLGCPASGGGGG